MIYFQKQLENIQTLINFYSEVNIVSSVLAQNLGLVSKKFNVRPKKLTTPYSILSI